ncbi:MAG: hypothetical protein Q4D23_03345, partial [Bacteroidales bacterium]|nr:hypothetical protein [Bacteroidales bacterium]
MGYRIEWLLVLSLPLAYIFAFAVRIGQCNGLGLPYGFYPVTTNDFLQYLVPAIAAVAPMSLAVFIARQRSHGMRYLFFVTLIMTEVLYILLRCIPFAQSREILLGISVALAFYFVGLALAAIWPLVREKKSTGFDCFMANKAAFARDNLLFALGSL